MAEPREEFLEADKEIPGQKFVCLSFISPENVLANKDVAFFTAFVNDYEIQYKIKATEEFLMKEMRRVSDTLSKAEDQFEALRGKLADISGGETLMADISGTMNEFKQARATLARDVASNLETYVKGNMRDFKETRIQEDYETFLFKNRKRLEDEFFAKNKDTFDFIYIDGDHTAYGVMKDAVNAYECLSIGGILAFDDYMWPSGKGVYNEPKVAIDAFLAVYGNRIKLIQKSYQVWCVKLA
jgi:hypothetical protein